MTTTAYTCLSIDRAMQYVGDMQGVLSLLDTLQQSLQSDLPHIQARLDAGDPQGANQVLHQIKGFAPVFCTEDLVTEVVRVEGLEQGHRSAGGAQRLCQLAPRLQQLLAEVQTCLAAPR